MSTCTSKALEMFVILRMTQARQSAHFADGRPLASGGSLGVQRQCFSGARTSQYMPVHRLVLTVVGLMLAIPDVRMCAGTSARSGAATRSTVPAVDCPKRTYAAACSYTANTARHGGQS